MLNNNPKLRIFLSAVLGFAGGNSLSTAVFPFATKFLFDTASFDLLGVMRMALPIAALWAVGGVIVAARRGIPTGLITMSLCGLIAGAALGVASFGMAGPWWIGPLVGLIYGSIGGLVLGAVFNK